MEALLAKKSEGRSLGPEEYQQIAAFMDRVEKRTIEVQAEADEAELQRTAEAKADINPAAFNISASLCEMADLTDLEVDLSIVRQAAARVDHFIFVQGQPGIFKDQFAGLRLPWVFCRR